MYEDALDIEYVRVCREHHLELVELPRRRNDLLVCPHPDGEHPATRVMPPVRPGAQETVRTAYEIWTRTGGKLIARYARVEGTNVLYDDTREDPDRKLAGRDDGGMSTTPERPDRRRRRFGILAAAISVATLAVSAPAHAANLQSGEVVLRAEGGAQVTMVGAERDASTKATMFVEVDAPVRLWGESDNPDFRGRASLHIVGKPGVALNGGDIETFQTVQATLGAWRVVGSTISEGILVAVGAEWSYGARLNDGGNEPADRLEQRYGGGVRVYHKSSGLGVQLTYGHDGFVREGFGSGQLMPELALSVPGTDGIVTLRVQSSIDLAPALPPQLVAYLGEPGTDYHRVAATIDVAKLVGRLRGSDVQKQPAGGTWTSRR